MLSRFSPKEIMGASPISLPAFVTGKAALIGCSFFFLVRTMRIDTMLWDSMITRTLGICLYICGLLLLIVALIQLGNSVAVGIPKRETELKTHGLYRFSRNPIYVGGFLICAGSCLHSIHVVNFLLFAITVTIHLRIVSREEGFLEQRFGEKWLEYKSTVPRFIGRTRRYH